MEVSTRPASWLRRWTRFPMYFQAVQPRFELRAKRISPGQTKTLEFHLEFSDKAFRSWTVDVSSFAVGQSTRYVTPRSLLSPTGDARIILYEGVGSFDTLYAFVVSSEAVLFASVVFLLLNVLLVALLSRI